MLKYLLSLVPSGVSGHGFIAMKLGIHNIVG